MLRRPVDPPRLATHGANNIDRQKTYYSYIINITKAYNKFTIHSLLRGVDMKKIIIILAVLFFSTAAASTIEYSDKITESQMFSAVNTDAEW